MITMMSIPKTKTFLQKKGEDRTWPVESPLAKET